MAGHSRKVDWHWLWKSYEDEKLTRDELVLWFARGQDIENFLAELPKLPAGYLQEIKRYVQDPMGRKKLLEELFQWTCPVIYEIRKATVGVGLFRDLISMLKRRKEQVDFPATVVVIVLWTLLVASPLIIVGLLAWPFVSPMVWWRMRWIDKQLSKKMVSVHVMTTK
jgi:hypothetical protein